MAFQVNIEDYFIPYLVLLFNSFLFYLIRSNFIEKISPISYRLFFNEIISTIELCADCAELGVVWEIHGNYGLGIALFILCLWWFQVFDDAEACPCGPIEDCLIIGRRFTEHDIVKKLFGQLIGAYLTSKYTSSVWCWHLSEQHRHYHENQCESTLFVDPVSGAAIEGLITFISRIVALESEEWNHLVSVIINSIVTVFLVLIALNTTGGYFNPIMASALTFGCEGSTYWEHFEVYWLGAMIGSLAARWCHKTLLQNKSNKID